LPARLIIEEVLEGEARDALRRAYYASCAKPATIIERSACTDAEGAIEYSAHRSPRGRRDQD
jgi:hypothetical protein